MKKFKQIIGLVTTGALSLALSVSAMVANFTKADAAEPIVVDSASIESNFTANGNIVTANTVLPDYILNRANSKAQYSGPISGVKVTFKDKGEENAVVYNKTFNVNDFNGANSLAKLIPVPAKSVFDDSKVEFSRLRLTIFEVDNDGNETGKEVTVIFSSGSGNATALNDISKGGSPSSYFSAYAANSATEVQTPFGYYFNGVPRYDGSGCGVASSEHASMRETTKPITVEYLEQGGVYSAKVSPVKGSWTDNTIRKFNEYTNPADLGATDKNGAVDDSLIFSGFGSDAKLKVKFYIDDFTTVTEASFMFYQIGNEKLESRVLADTANYYGIAGADGAAGLNFPIPTARYYNANGVLTASNYNVEVYAPGATTATFSGVNLASFAPTKDGEYEIKYYCDVEGYRYCYSTKATVLKVGSNTIKFDAYTAENDKYNVYGSDYYVYAKVSGGTYNDGTLPALKAELYKKSASGNYDTKVQDLVMGEYLNLKSLNTGFGEFEVRYTATDVYGDSRKQVKSVYINALEENRTLAAIVNGKEGETQNFYYGSTAKLTISASDVTIYDAMKGRDYIDAEIYITDTLNDKELQSGTVDFGTYLATKNNRCGSYKIEYVYTDSTITPAFNKTFIKYVNVVDAIAPTFNVVGDNYILNAKVNYNKTTGKDVIYLQAKKGTALKFGEIIAIDTAGEKLSLTEDIVLTVTKPDKTKDASVAFASTGLTYTVNENGEYVFKFSVCDLVNSAPNRETSLVMIVEVADNFYTAVVDTQYGINNNFDSVNLAALKVVDFNGNVVNGTVSTVTAYNRDGEAVWSGNAGDVKKFTLAGEYDIVTEVKLNGSVIATDTQKVTVYDKMKPTITVSGTLVKKAMVGTEVKLADVTASDETSNPNLIVEITNGTNFINVYNGKFTPLEAGDYVVTYTATDLAGNVNVYSYVIKVVEQKEGGLAAFFNGSGLFVAIPLIVLAIGAAAFYVTKVSKKSKSIEVTEDASESVNDVDNGNED